MSMASAGRQRREDMADQDLDELLDLRAVLKAEGCSRSTLYSRIQRGEFPAPLPNPSGRAANRWRRSEVVAHQKARFARLDALARRKAEQAAA
jgi:predicted DNA-binding transcriptional regulator AlpA